ncbi:MULTISPECIES: D-glucuronyl C5-epimerase family protein [unclassified Haladaptatus]|uniref:D-glucuronyl C5-epimerase family protein n=1 Tax=unclassified Haladaptatus TaxID=2622732 RepID=UPI0023E853D1|nr:MULTISPECIES: D-glucuronyl C5-epimerase family protein [unclassified Haladaptatus]
MSDQPSKRGPRPSRRHLLALGASLGLAGCMDITSGFEKWRQDGPATTSTNTPAATSTATPQTETATETETETPEPVEEAVNGVPIKRTEFTYRELPYEERPQFFGQYRDAKPQCDKTVSQVNELPDLIPATVGDHTGHFPLRTTRWLLRCLHCYRESGKQGYLDRAEEFSQALVDDAAIGPNDGIYFSYRLDKAGSSADLKAPWYSGMCQGVGLSAYTYFHELTGDDKYLDLAERVFQTFKSVKRTTDGPWTTMVDPNGYYWVEEYPFEPPTHVINGKCIGIWGLYDYWLHTESAEAKLLLDATLTTVQNYADHWRVPGEVSYYGLDGYRRWQLGQTDRYPDPYRGNDYYHGVHLIQIDKLYKLTGDEFFKQMWERYKSDDPGDMS